MTSSQPLAQTPQQSAKSSAWTNRRMPLATSLILLALSVLGLVLSIQDLRDATKWHHILRNGQVKDTQQSVDSFFGRLAVQLILLIVVCGLQSFSCIAGVVASWRLGRLWTQNRIRMYKAYCYVMGVLVVARIALVAALIHVGYPCDSASGYTMVAALAQAVGMGPAYMFLWKFEGKVSREDGVDKP